VLLCEKQVFVWIVEKYLCELVNYCTASADPRTPCGMDRALLPTLCPLRDQPPEGPNLVPTEILPTCLTKDYTTQSDIFSRRLQRGSIACYTERCISYDRLCLTL